MLAESLQGVISQLLCRTADGQGRVAVHEILLWTEGLPNTIREGHISNIRTIIESNKGIGMCSMDSCLVELMEQNHITPYEAYMKATDKKRFAEYLPEDAKI
jgi:twitching motility protein PilT